MITPDRPPGVDQPPQPDPATWRTTSSPPVPAEKFGKDHWSTLAYVETRIVDYGGLLQADHMRCHSGRHPILAAARRVQGDSDGSQYPTRLKGGDQLADHDDYDCVDDLIAAGLLEAHMPQPHPDGRAVYVTHHGATVTPKMLGHMEVPSPYFTTGMDELLLMAAAAFTLTEEGQRVAAQLRAHKGNGGNYGDFTPDPPPAAATLSRRDNEEARA